MNKFKVFLCIGYLLWGLPTLSHAAECLKYTPHVIVHANPGRVKYVTTQSRREFIAAHPGTPATTLGLTTSEFKVTMTGKPRIRQLNHQMACVGLQDVIFNIGFDTITVYIGKEFKPGTCQYKVIKDHENYHVAVFRKGMDFFKSDVENALRKSVSSIQPEKVNSQSQAQAVLKKQFDKIQKDIKPLVEHINKVLEKKNREIDTEESYKKASDQCESW